MKSRILEMWKNNPLKLIILTAIILRIISAIFSKGFGMHDDHFLVLEPPQSWVDGYDYNRWLPGSSSEAVPSGHSFFYVGIHYLILLFFKYAGIADPQTKMFIIRLLHAAFSLITVYYGYKITLKLSNGNTAKITGLMLAALWFMPVLSVRNLVEVVCIPFMMLATWKIIKHSVLKSAAIHFFVAGVLVGLGFSVRFQTLFFALGLDLQSCSAGGGRNLSCMLLDSFCRQLWCRVALTFLFGVSLSWNWESMSGITSGIQVPTSIIHGIITFY
ncbi:MAG: glycosyltransferase family 39 protein [Bacteroidetes bacterium]|nr:glycosyltransferase family 39 protein [Bacteroidota bacterium]